MGKNIFIKFQTGKYRRKCSGYFSFNLDWTLWWPTDISFHVWAIINTDNREWSCIWWIFSWILQEWLTYRYSLRGLKICDTAKDLTNKHNHSLQHQFQDYLKYHYSFNSFAMGCSEKHRRALPRRWLLRKNKSLWYVLLWKRVCYSPAQ
jgi:hypothetical protein